MVEAEAVTTAAAAVEATALTQLSSEAVVEVVDLALCLMDVLVCLVMFLLKDLLPLLL